MLAAEELPDEDLEAVLDLGLLSDGDIASNARSADQDHECHFQHLFVI